MNVTVAEVVGSQPYNQKAKPERGIPAKAMMSWFLLCTDGQRLKVNTEPKNDIAPGDAFDAIVKTEWDPWHHADGNEYWSASRANGSVVLAPRGPKTPSAPAASQTDEPPHPALTGQQGPPQGSQEPIPGYREAAGAKQGNRARLSAEIDLWIADITAKANEHEMPMTAAEVMDNARALAIHVAIGQGWKYE